MDVRVGDKLIMKKNHPCGSNEFAAVSYTHLTLPTT